MQIRVSAHVLVLCALVAVLTFGCGLSFWNEARTEAALETALRQDISLLERLPGQRVTLDRQQDLMRKSRSRIFFIAAFAAQALLPLLLVFYLLRYILRPIRVVDEVAADWTLGTPWPAQTASSLPEIRGLITHLGQMAARLNGEFGKVRQFSDFKTKLVSVVSHEFGNSLAVMQTAVFLLKEQQAPDSFKENAYMWDMLSSNIIGLTEASRNLLNMGRHEAGHIAVEFAPIDAPKILFDVMRRLQLLYEKRGLFVSLELSPRLKPVRADQAVLTLIVSNLVSNAIKYTPPGGRIILGVLRVASHPGHYRVVVRDTGIGFSKEERDHILGDCAFYRTERGKAMTPKGFGIGLSLVKLMVEAHGSTLELKSHLGKGSSFSFLLPIYSSGPLQPEQSKLYESSTKNPRASELIVLPSWLVTGSTPEPRA